MSVAAARSAADLAPDAPAAIENGPCRRPETRFPEEVRTMKKLLPTVIALALALVSLLPGAAAAKLAANHNQALLRG